MANYIGPIKEVDHYIGENLIVAKYIGETKYFDAYNDISGELPLIFQSRVEHNLKNYRIYGTPEGAGKETESGEPAGYKIPLTIMSGEQSSDYNLYIGDSKLGEEEYVDFKEQKIYKMIDGTLTPTDPPIALPSISTSQGENTLSSTETLGEITIKGRIRELTYRRVEYLKSTGTQYIQTDIVPLYSYKSELRIKFGSEIHQIENKDYTYIFGISGAAALGVYCVQLDGSSGNIIRFRDGYYSTDTSITGINPVVEDALIMNRPTSFYGNASLTTNAAIEGINPPVEPIVIFGLTGVSAGAKRIWPFKRRDMFLYEFKIYDSNDSLLNDLIPVEREDGELGLLDTITNKFYVNAGTGTFEKGAYIEGDINDTQSNT